MTNKKSKKPRTEVARKGRVSITFPEPSLTQQQFKSSVDVNNIVNHYKNTGIDPYESRKQSLRFGTATSKGFTEAMYQVAEVNSAFAELPAETRQSFSNDPTQWLTHLEESAQAPAEIAAPDGPEAVSEDGTPSDPPPADLSTPELNIT